MVSKARPELHTRAEERRIWLLELVDEIRRLLPAIHVVAEHDHEIVGECGMRRRHLPGDFILWLVAGAVVSYSGELQGAGLVWKRCGLLGRRDDREAGDGGHEPACQYDSAVAVTAREMHRTLIVGR